MNGAKTYIIDAPGSSSAYDKGCTCPVIDNHYGRGRVLSSGVSFFISGDCPLHAKQKDKTDGTEQRT